MNTYRAATKIIDRIKDENRALNTDISELKTKNNMLKQQLADLMTTLRNTQDTLSMSIQGKGKEPEDEMIPEADEVVEAKTVLRIRRKH